jgi:hypothetical protein
MKRVHHKGTKGTKEIPDKEGSPQRHRGHRGKTRKMHNGNTKLIIDVLGNQFYKFT